MENAIDLAIAGMHCGACVRRVDSALRATEGVTVDSVEVGSARIAFDDAKTTVQNITAALHRCGFQAHIQPAELHRQQQER